MSKQKQSSLDSFVKSKKTATKRDHSDSESEQESHDPAKLSQMESGFDSKTKPK